MSFSSERNYQKSCVLCRKCKAQEAEAQEAKAQEAEAQEAKAQEAEAQEAKAQEAKIIYNLKYKYLT